MLAPLATQLVHWTTYSCLPAQVTLVRSCEYLLLPSQMRHLRQTSSAQSVAPSVPVPLCMSLPMQAPLAANSAVPSASGLLGTVRGAICASSPLERPVQALTPARQWRHLRQSALSSLLFPGDSGSRCAGQPTNPGSGATFAGRITGYILLIDHQRTELLRIQEAQSP